MPRTPIDRPLDAKSLWRSTSALLCNSAPGDVLFDPFVGSGTAFIAAEKTGRRCLGLELEPRYVQATIDRWEAYSGQTARKVDTIRAEPHGMTIPRRPARGGVGGHEPRAVIESRAEQAGGAGRRRSDAARDRAGAGDLASGGVEDPPAHGGPADGDLREDQGRQLVRVLNRETSCIARPCADCAQPTRSDAPTAATGDR